MKKEYEFLANNSKLLSKHRGEWIAVVGKKIVSHGKRFEKVLEKAQEVAKEPVLLKIPKEEVVVYLDRISIY